jgi:hypothetical protein
MNRRTVVAALLVVFGFPAAGLSAVGFPANGILDGFNRQNQGPPPSASWKTLQHGHVVNSNRCVGVTENDDNVSQWNVRQFPANDAEMYITWPSSNCQVAFYMTDLVSDASGPNNGYQAWVENSNTIHIIRMDAGVEITLGNLIHQTFSSGDSFGFESLNGVLTVYRKPAGGNWVEIDHRYDSTYSHVIHLILETWSLIPVDDFGGGGVTGAYGFTTYVPAVQKH